MITFTWILKLSLVQFIYTYDFQFFNPMCLFLSANICNTTWNVKSHLWYIKIYCQMILESLYFNSSKLKHYNVIRCSVHIKILIMNLWELRFSCQLWSSGIWCHLLWQMGTNVLEEPAGFFFCHNGGSSRFIQNAATNLQNYTVLHPRRP